MTHSSRTVRRPVVVAILSGLALLLAGCGARYDFVIRDNETADLTYTMWDSSELSLISRESCTEKNLEKSTPLPKGVKAVYTYTSHNGHPACQVTAKSVALNKLQTDVWTIKHKGGQYVFDLSPDALSKLGDDSSLPSSRSVTGGTKVSITVTFPEEVTKSNGRNDGNKVTWDNVLENPEALHAEGGDGKFHLQWWMIAAASTVVLLIVVGVVVYLLRARRAQRLTPTPSYNEALQGAVATDAMPPEVYIGGPYQSPPGPLQPMQGSTHPYPVTNLRDGYAPYADPGLGAGAFPPPQVPGGAGVFSTYGAQEEGGHHSPGPGYTQMPYQEGHSPADFRPPPQQPR
ncbi:MULTISPECIES: LppM family (lipo)protein [Actinomyces]|uniref:LppM domain-containing protein n=1 Tax=Actinomyces oris TaxID=544580 RepID=A0A1Q8VLC9_9ACTO|nr:MULTISPECIES: hypothetical protein [Actinomyces]OLO48906.1 hypothetical protein BKH28_07955 [Actinomyces oris]